MMNLNAQLLTKGAKCLTIRSFSSDGSYESKDSQPFNLSECQILSEKRQNASSNHEPSGNSHLPTQKSAMNQNAQMSGSQMSQVSKEYYEHNHASDARHNNEIDANSYANDDKVRKAKK